MNRKKVMAWGAAATGVGILIGVDVVRQEAKLESQIDREIVALANDQPVTKTHFELGRAISSAAAIEATLDNMGSDFGDVRRAAGAACLVAELNGADTATGIDNYVKGLKNDDPNGYPTALRACESAAASLQVTTFEYPLAIASE